MNKEKWIPALCALLAAVLILGSIGLCLHGVNAPAQVLALDPAAAEQAEEWARQVCRGDYEAAGKMMYGQPELTSGEALTDETARLFWDAYVESLQFDFEGDCYGTPTGLARDVTVTALDISALMGPLKRDVEAQMALQAAESEEQDLIFDENNNYRDDFVMGVLRDAAKPLLEASPKTVRCTLTIHLLYEDDRWWILADQDLIDVLSGKIA